MIKTDEKIALQQKLNTRSPGKLYPVMKPVNSRVNSIDKLVDFMAGGAIHYQKNAVNMNIRSAANDASVTSKIDNNIAYGLSGSVFMQLCNVIINRTALKERKLLSLYSSAKQYNIDNSFSSYNMNGSLLYLEYLFHKNLIGWFDLAAFNKRLYSILNLIRKKDAPVDVISGMAGTLIVCSRMYLLCPNKMYESAVRYLASSIVQRALHVDKDCVTWSKKWTGFAYGNSGIAYALLLANNILNSKEINAIVIKALKYEQLFKIHNGWKSTGIYHRKDDLNAWCHGATGIYLARKTMLEENYFASSELPDILYADIEHYINSKKHRAINIQPSLCHGVWGNAMIDPQSYGEYLKEEPLAFSATEDKSLMHGAPGAFYAHLFIHYRRGEIPNLLLLK